MLDYEKLCQLCGNLPECICDGAHVLAAYDVTGRYVVLTVCHDCRIKLYSPTGK